MHAHQSPFKLAEPAFLVCGVCFDLFFNVFIKGAKAKEGEGEGANANEERRGRESKKEEEKG